MGLAGAGDIMICMVPHSSFRVKRSSVGCIVSQKGAAKLRMGKGSSEECNAA